MSMREVDNMILRDVNAKNIFTEIHRLEGRMDFLFLCNEIPEDVKKKEMEQAQKQMDFLQIKLLTYQMKGEL